MSTTSLTLSRVLLPFQPCFLLCTTHIPNIYVYQLDYHIHSFAYIFALFSRDRHQRNHIQMSGGSLISFIVPKCITEYPNHLPVHSRHTDEWTPDRWGGD